MKKIISFIVLFILFFLAISFKPENKYILTEGQALMVYQSLQLAKENIPSSEMPINKAAIFFKNADSIQGIISYQYQHLNDSTKK